MKRLVLKRETAVKRNKSCRSSKTGGEVGRIFRPGESCNMPEDLGGAGAARLP